MARVTRIMALAVPPRPLLRIRSAAPIAVMVITATLPKRVILGMFFDIHVAKTSIFSASHVSIGIACRMMFADKSDIEMLNFVRASRPFL